MEEFTLHLAYPLVIVGHQGSNTFLLSPKAAKWLEKLDLPPVNSKS